MSRILNHRAGATRNAVRTGVVVLACMALSSCDLSVTNPGPVQDPNLDNTAAHVGLVNGAMRQVLMGWGNFAHQAAPIVREYQPTRQTGSDGIQNATELGIDLHEQEWISAAYVLTQQGRWIGEHAVERLKAVLGTAADSNRELGRAYLWAGVGNRVLGEHMCSAIFDTGAPEPYLRHFSRAVEQFNNAERIATAARDEQTRMAAIAFRAAANVFLGNWSAAVTDAAKIPLDYTFAVQFQNRGVSDNLMRFSGERYPLHNFFTGRGISLWSTAAETYFTATGDPRQGWGFSTADPRATSVRSTWGDRPLVYWPLKMYQPRGPTERTVFAPNSVQVHARLVNLATGREMQLIRAEALLVQGNFTAAMPLINQVRQRNNNYFTNQPLAPLTATTLEQAWAALKLERRAELFLEGRRFGDRRRWAEAKTPGALDPAELMPDNHVTKFKVAKIPTVCFPFPRAETERNFSIPTDYKAPFVNG